MRIGELYENIQERQNQVKNDYRHFFSNAIWDSHCKRSDKKNCSKTGICMKKYNAYGSNRLKKKAVVFLNYFLNLNRLLYATMRVPLGHTPGYLNE